MNIALYCLIVVDSFFLGKNSYLSSLQGLTAFETHGKDVCGVAVSNHNGDSKEYVTQNSGCFNLHCSHSI